MGRKHLSRSSLHREGKRNTDCLLEQFFHTLGSSPSVLFRRLWIGVRKRSIKDLGADGALIAGSQDRFENNVDRKVTTLTGVETVLAAPGQKPEGFRLRGWLEDLRVHSLRVAYLDVEYSFRVNRAREKTHGPREDQARLVFCGINAPVPVRVVWICVLNL
jgi:hypothetical protein